MTAPETADNPLLAPWDTPEAAPPFAQIRPEHFRPAYAQALPRTTPRSRPSPGGPAARFRQHDRGAGAERAGAQPGRACVPSAGRRHTNDALLAIEREMSPRLAGHWNPININAACSAASTR